jgi:hypothetical protein
MSLLPIWAFVASSRMKFNFTQVTCSFNDFTIEFETYWGGTVRYTTEDHIAYIRESNIHASITIIGCVNFRKRSQDSSGTMLTMLWACSKWRVQSSIPEKGTDVSEKCAVLLSWYKIMHGLERMSDLEQLSFTLILFIVFLLSLYSLFPLRKVSVDTKKVLKFPLFLLV